MSEGGGKENNGWKKAGVVLGVIVSMLLIIGAWYTADCINLKKEGIEYFATIDTVIAMQKRVESRFNAWDLKAKIAEIGDLDRRYGPGCQRCDPKLKGYYKLLVIERDRLIEAAKKSGPK